MMMTLLIMMNMMMVMKRENHKSVPEASSRPCGVAKM
jgi:S-ribosylhomocysteine lyase LuxS involved in autoinducer biosynthesis